MEGENIIMGLKTIVNQWTFGFGIKKNSYFILSSLWSSYMYVNFGVAISLENPGER